MKLNELWRDELLMMIMIEKVAMGARVTKMAIMTGNRVERGWCVIGGP